MDLVEHQGGTIGGHYACTLAVVDVVTGWNARMAVPGKSKAVVLGALAVTCSVRVSLG